MTDDPIQRTESKLKAAEAIPEDRKTEALDLLSQLKARIATLSETHEEEAARIARMMETSAHEATSPEKKSGPLESSLHGLKQSVEGFEASHPDVVKLVNDFATALANMGL